MSQFRPLRASPPPKPSAVPSSRVSDVTDPPRAMGITAPELIGLSAEEIDFIDEVISRVPATATSLPVFKAYNDVLQERGLDPQNEVVYYGKLLKIYTLKGKNWTDKWNMVKEQQGYVSKASTSTRGGRTTRVARTTPATSMGKAPVQALYIPRERDALTLHSHQDDTERTDDEPPTRLTPWRRVPGANIHNDTSRPDRRFGSPATAASANSLGLDTGPPSSLLDSGDALRRIAARARNAAVTRWDAETTMETTTQASSIPPSYGVAVRDEPEPLMEKGKEKAPIPQRNVGAYPASSPMPAVQPLSEQLSQPSSRERRGSVVGAEDPFEKLRREQDEEVADRFRNDRLVERCYEVWKQGYEWVITTSEQIAEARDMLVLRRALQRWRQRTVANRELLLRVTALSNRRCQKRVIQVWRQKLREKKQVHWREDMRARMKTVRERDERRLKKDMWAKWRQSYLSRLSEKQFTQKVAIRFFSRWKAKLKKLDELEAAAEHFMYVREEKTMDRYWESWRRAAQLHRAERTMRERVELRLMANAVDAWRRQHHQYHVAERFNDTLAVKHALHRWKAARERLRSMERRALKHLARRDDVLVRAIMRIWKAHERGKLLTRVQTLRMLKQAWSVWQRRMEEQKEREEMAQLFQTRSASVLGATIFKRWRDMLQSHHNAQSFAVHYHRAQLQYKILLAWRLQLRAKLRMVKQAKVAQRYLLLRRCFRVWNVKVAEKKRLHQLKEFELRVTKRSFEEWRQKAHEARGAKLIRQRIAMRIMSTTLMHWTTRVADLKLRELETTHYYEKRLVVNALQKWKALRKRRVDELSLMESYQDIKREENMRKMFYRWLAAAKKSRHRRLQLQAKEEEFKLTVIAGAWDKWREHFLDIRLQPLADAFLKQRQTDILFRAFAVWHSKSLSLPAVRFHASHVKAKHWKKWRELMPQVLQAKTAREIDRRNTLKRAFSHWRKAQQKKIDFKAINRARWIKLLSPASPQASQPPRTSALASRARSVFPTPRNTRSAIRSANEAEPPRPASSVSRTAYTQPSLVKPNRARITDILTTESRADSPERKPRSPERPKFNSRRTAPRELSPSETGPDPAPPSYRGGIEAWRKEVRPLPPKSAPPSVAGDVATNGGRSSLWQELKEVRRRSRAPTERTYSPEPL